MGVDDAVIAELAGRQHGVVAVWQLAAAGISRDAVKHRVARRRLTRLHRGVYRLGPVHGPLTSPMAAVLACGPAAVLSHESAAELLGIRRPERGPIHVTVPTGHPRTRNGIRVHRARLGPDDVTRWKGIPTTTAARTIRDLAPTLTERHLKRAIEEAQIQGHLTSHSLTEAVDQARGRKGVTALRAATTNEPRLTRSEAERRLVELIDAAELPRPRTNQRVEGFEVDLVWPDARLIVEVDGYAFHQGREAFERDRRRDAELTAAGYRVQRVTWRQIADTREAVVARLARSLSAGPAPARPPVAAGLRGSPHGRPRW